MLLPCQHMTFCVIAARGTMAHGAIARIPASRPLSLPQARPSALSLRTDGASRRYFLVEIASSADAADSVNNQVQRTDRQITGDRRHIMLRKARVRFWIEVILATVTAALLLLTLISREWIE